MIHGFVREMRRDPSDDAVRLICADWLEEHGSPDRAKYVRSSVAGAAVSRSDAPWIPEEFRSLDSSFGLSCERGFATTAFVSKLAMLTADLARRLALCGPLDRGIVVGDKSPTGIGRWWAFQLGGGSMPWDVPCHVFERLRSLTVFDRQIAEYRDQRTALADLGRAVADWCWSLVEETLVPHALFVGGPWDGKRVPVDDPMPPRMMVPVMQPHHVAWNQGTVPEDPHIDTAVYVLQKVDGICFYAESGMDFGAAMESLVQGYKRP